MTSEGKPYAPERFREIVREKYVISRQANIGYEDTSLMSPLERRYFLEFLMEDLERQQEAIDRARRSK